MAEVVRDYFELLISEATRNTEDSVERTSEEKEEEWEEQEEEEEEEEEEKEEDEEQEGDQEIDEQQGQEDQGEEEEPGLQEEQEHTEAQEEERPPEQRPGKKPPTLVYPPMSPVARLEDNFVGDQPLYPECPYILEAGSPALKVKRYGYVEPPNFVKNSKNPCWFESNGKKDLIKCVPFFYIIGAAKCGTADLLNRVRGHPNVRSGGPAAFYWWDRLRYGASKSLKYTKEAKRGQGGMQLKEYSKQIVGNHGKNLTMELHYSGKSKSIFGDASPTYLTENTQWEVMEGNEGCSEPRVIPATFIRHIFPQARIIVMLRDPVERLYSRFLAKVPYVYEYENATWSLFHTFVYQAVHRYRDCLARMSVRHCAYNTSLFTSAVVRLSEGMYTVFLEDWFRVFPKEQILIMKYEEYVEDIQGHLRKVFEHLDIEELDDDSLQKLAELPLVRKGRVRQEAGYTLPETIALLSEFYAPFNLRLAEILGDDKWLFKRHDLPVAPMPVVAPPPYAPFTFPELFPGIAPQPPHGRHSAKPKENPKDAKQSPEEEVEEEGDLEKPEMDEDGGDENADQFDDDI